MPFRTSPEAISAVLGRQVDVLFGRHMANEYSRWNAVRAAAGLARQ